MQSEDHRIGITPILLRRAAYYLSLGVGEYFPEHPHYDKITVDEQYPLTQNPSDHFVWAVGFRVSFYKDNRRVRWIDFCSTTTGAGGDPILKKVDDT